MLIFSVLNYNSHQSTFAFIINLLNNVPQSLDIYILDNSPDSGLLFHELNRLKDESMLDSFEFEAVAFQSLFINGNSNFGVHASQINSSMTKYRIITPFGNVISIFLILSKTNIGFGRGHNLLHNLILNRSYDDNDSVFISNNDISFNYNVFSQLSDALFNDRYSFISPLIKFKSMPNAIWYGGGHYNRLKGTAYHTNLDLDSIRRDSEISELKPTEFLCGCLIACKFNVLRSLFPLFDAKFFIYGEDTDLSLRLKSLGYNSAVLLSSLIYHEVGASAGKNSQKKLNFYTNFARLMIVKKWERNLLIKILFYLYFFSSRLFLSIFKLDPSYLYGIKDAFSQNPLGRQFHH